MASDLPDAPPDPRDIEKDPSIAKDLDERISFDKNAKKWIFEGNRDDEQIEFYYDFDKKQWIETDIDGTAQSGTKRELSKSNLDQEEEENKQLIKKAKKETLKKIKEEQKLKELSSESWKPKNTGVYISKLPSDVSKEEIVEAFSKCGLISEDFKTGEPRVKLYYEGDKFKNEALVIYHNFESVDLAIDLLNGTSLRSSTSDDTEKIEVTAAQFNTPNKEKTVEKKKLTAEQKRIMRERKESLKKELYSWDDSENPDDKLDQIKSKMFSKIVVIKNMFRVVELRTDPMLEMDLKEDIQEECSKLGIDGDVTSVTFYDISEVVTIKFKSPDSSKKCIENFNGRFFDGLRLEAYKYDGQKFQKTKKDEMSEESRLESFGTWVEGNGQS